MIMITHPLKKILPLVAVLLAVAGCSNGNKTTAPVPAPQQPRTAVTSTVTSTVTTTAESEVYRYIPGGRRDPFTPIVIREEKKTLGGARTPLERYAINEFKLTGIVWGGLGYHAMLEGPDGKGYFVKPGTIIGPNHGVIKKITQTSMTIEEKFKDPAGELQKKEIVIELRKKQEATP
jgi:type IV pilus assembly protein PilP